MQCEIIDILHDYGVSHRDADACTVYVYYVASCHYCGSYYYKLCPGCTPSDQLLDHRMR